MSWANDHANYGDQSLSHMFLMIIGIILCLRQSIKMIIVSRMISPMSWEYFYDDHNDPTHHYDQCNPIHDDLPHTQITRIINMILIIMIKTLQSRGSAQDDYDMSFTHDHSDHSDP